MLIGLGGAMNLLLGALDVLGVVIALSLLKLGRGGPGLLVAAYGGGGVIGSAATVLLVGRTRLAPPLLIGLLACGTSLALVGIAPGAAVAIGLLALSGAGGSLADVAGRTLLQRVTDTNVLARLFGLLEGLEMAALAAGSAAATGLVVWLGPRGAVIGAGVFLPVLALLVRNRLFATDRAATAPIAAIDVLRSLPLFAPLPSPVIERLAKDARPIRVPAGGVVVRQGDIGDRFYVVRDGVALVTVDGDPVRELRGGDHFGEIALLRDVPRTASVVAASDLELLALERDPFLEAVTGHPRSLRAAQLGIAGLMPE